MNSNLKIHENNFYNYTEINSFNYICTPPSKDNKSEESKYLSKYYTPLNQLEKKIVYETIKKELFNKNFEISENKKYENLETFHFSYEIKSFSTMNHYLDKDILKIKIQEKNQQKDKMICSFCNKLCHIF